MKIVNIKISLKETGWWG